MKPKAPHSLYFLVRSDGRAHATLAAIKDVFTREPFICVFVSAHDAEEFAVTNDLLFGRWEVSEAQGPDSVRKHVALALRDGGYKAVVNPPPVIHGTWRTLPIKFLHEWSQRAKEPLLAWPHYEVLPKEAGKRTDTRPDPQADL